MNRKTFYGLFLLIVFPFLAVGAGEARASSLPSPAVLKNPLLDSLAVSASSVSTVGGAFRIVDQTVDSKNPVVAYNSQREEYMVVWWNDRPGNDDIQAQRISKGGTPVGGSIWVSAGAGEERRHPDVAYNSQTDEYLVVWENYDSADGYSIHGRLISGAGALIGIGEIPIRTTASSLFTVSTPVLSYDSTPGKYMVVWVEEYAGAPTTWDLVGQAVGQGGGLEGGAISIASGYVEISNPDIAYNRHANGALVAWQQADAFYSHIYTCLLDGDGPPPYFSTQELGASLSYNQVGPAVAALPNNSTSNKFLVMWDLEYSSGTTVLEGMLVGEDGTPFETTPLEIGSSGAYPSHVAAVGNEGARRFMTVWITPINMPPPGPSYVGLKGQTFNDDRASEVDLPWFVGMYADNPSMANGSSGDVLLVFEDSIGGNKDIWGIILGNRVYLPLVTK